MNIIYSFLLLILATSISYKLANAQSMPTTAMTTSQETEIANKDAEVDRFDKFHPPLDVFEFIHNLKNCIKLECLLNDQFFEEKNLLNFTNGQDVESFENDKQFYFVRNLKMTGIHYGISIYRKITLDRWSGRIETSFDNPSPNVDYMIKMFGAPKQAENSSEKILLAHRPVLKLKTHKYGNSHVYHILIGQNSITKITTETSFDGSIKRLSVKQSTKLGQMLSDDD